VERRAGIPRGATSRAAVFSHRPAVRRNAVRQQTSVRKKKRSRGQWVLDDLSGTRVGGRAQAPSKPSPTASFGKNGVWSNTALIP